MAAPGLRLRELDVLRAIAILLVLGRHLRPCLAESSGPFGVVFEVWNRCGWAGVDLFFVLSGFLIAGLLFREYEASRAISFRRFFLRRGLKIYPAFYAYLFASTLVKLVAGRSVAPLAFLSEALFVQNYGPAIQNHTWSLAVEEHFYLLLPAVLLLLGRSGKPGIEAFRPLIPGFVILAVLLVGLRAERFIALPFDAKTHIEPTHLRIDSLLFGVVLSYLYHFRREATVAFVRARQGIVCGLSVLLIAPMFFFDLGEEFFMPTLGLTGLYLGFGGLLLVSLCREGRAPGALEPLLSLLAGVGFYSYSIYVWHLNVAVGVRGLTELLFGGARHCVLEAAIYVPASILAGVVTAKIIEVPVLAFRDRKFPSRSADLTEPGPVEEKG